MASSSLPTASCATLACVLVASCFGIDVPEPPPGPNDPNRPGLAFTRVPTSAVLNGVFELRVRINDDKGRQRSQDGSTAVTVSASGGGTLGGTLTRVAVGGFVRFDDLVYDRWEAVALTARAAGFAEATTTAFRVRPLMRLQVMPPASASVEREVGPFVVELVDALGAAVPTDQEVHLDSTDPYVIVRGGRVRRFSEGRASFEGVTLASVGPQTLSWRSEGLNTLVQAFEAFGQHKTEALWLRPGRAGARYRTPLPAGEKGFALVEGALPAGLALDAEAGVVIGTPTLPQHARFKLASTDSAGVTTTWLGALTVFSLDETAARSADQVNGPGPFGVGLHRDRVEVRARDTSEALRIYYPTTNGAPAAGRFPIVVFQHGASRLDSGVASLFDRYDHLLVRWAQYGFVVMSVDALSLITRDGAYTPLTLMNLNLMAENMRAAIAFARAKDQDPAFPLAGHMDVERIIVAGHSRGGGAAIITARSTPTVMAMLLIKPVDPLAAMGGEVLWKQPLPAKPALMLIAGNDADVVYPLVDFVFERRAATMSSVTILGSLHAWSCDGCPPERGGVAQIKREEDWTISNVYATAFLRYVAHGRLSYAPLLFGRPGAETSLSPLGVLRRSDRHAVATVVDDFQDGAPMNALGLPTRATGPVTVTESPWMRHAVEAASAELGERRRSVYLLPEVLGFARSEMLRWSADASYATDIGALDVTRATAFVFRARSEAAPLGPAQVRARFVDAAGRAAVVDAISSAAGLRDRFQDVIIPRESFAAQGLALDQIARFELLLSGAGAMTIDDMRFE